MKSLIPLVPLAVGAGVGSAAVATLAKYRLDDLRTELGERYRRTQSTLEAERVASANLRLNLEKNRKRGLIRAGSETAVAEELALMTLRHHNAEVRASTAERKLRDQGDAHRLQVAAESKRVADQQLRSKSLHDKLLASNQALQNQLVTARKEMAERSEAMDVQATRCEAQQNQLLAANAQLRAEETRLNANLGLCEQDLETSRAAAEDSTNKILALQNTINKQNDKYASLRARHQEAKNKSRTYGSRGSLNPTFKFVYNTQTE